MENDLIEYVHKKMITDGKNYQWRIVFDSHKNALEIYFTFSLETEKKHYVQDINGRVNRNNLLQFEDVVCLYDEKNHLLVPESYLCAVPFDVKKGIEEGKIDALLKQLNIVVSGAKAQLREFLSDPNQNEFSLIWSEQNFQRTIETLKSTNHYSTKRRTIQTQEDKNLVEQFKEEQYDGVERI